MEEFAYAGLVALLWRVIAEHDRALLDGTCVADPMMGATADAAQKRALVQRIMDRQGPGLLLQVGQFLHLADETPALSVLRNSATPRVLAEKFMRLERYHHATHRVLIETGTDSWTCTRYSMAAEATDGENCLIAGLLLGLIVDIGLKGCKLEIGGHVYLPGDLTSAVVPQGTDTANFRISWTALPVHSDHAPSCASLASSGRVSDRLAAVIASDIGRSWKVADAAGILALSIRSMQRHLKAEMRSYSSVLRQARMKAATLLLTETDTSLAEIGYCCGYADQAHFQRDFLLTANVTPRRFRQINREADGLL
ncbi:AraC family transcriptional regulator [Phaeobacter sp. CAU 1743]|uniref:helix-turn-helix transcriptional regulator n=1 Tax=Phaeobacter sp. CAU 1743 TaxID=3140367 RepID=UPI0023B36F7F